MWHKCVCFYSCVSHHYLYVVVIRKHAIWSFISQNYLKLWLLACKSLVQAPNLTKKIWALSILSKQKWTTISCEKSILSVFIKARQLIKQFQWFARIEFQYPLNTYIYIYKECVANSEKSRHHNHAQAAFICLCLHCFRLDLLFINILRVKR